MTIIHHIGHAKGPGCPPHEGEGEFALPKTFHCRRCHENPPLKDYASHHKTCPGVSNPCKESCPPTGEPIDQPRKS